MFNYLLMDLNGKLKSKLLIGSVTKTGISKDLGISRVTLDTRLSKGNWKKGELALLRMIL